MNFQSEIMDEKQVISAITDIANQIKKENQGKQVHFIGIKTRGVPLARELSKEYSKLTGKKTLFGEIDIKEFRDDRPQKTEKVPGLKGINIPFDINDKNVVLVDDVLFTGRTVRAAIEGLVLLGRPKSVKVAVMIDRINFTEMPVFAAFAGKRINTKGNEVVSVSLTDTDSENSVKLYNL